MNDTPVAVVTAGAGGVGSAIGRTLTSEGFKVVLAGRKLAAAQRVANDIGEASALARTPGTSMSRTVNRSPSSPTIPVRDSGASTFW
jgi:NADP-dependent 3-hydroxy acid dehydrogenase YdfG